MKDKANLNFSLWMSGLLRVNEWLPEGKLRKHLVNAASISANQLIQIQFISFPVNQSNWRHSVYWNRNWIELWINDAEMKRNQKWIAQEIKPIRKFKTTNSEFGLFPAMNNGARWIFTSYN